jgi:hypothetical protein
MKSQNRQLRVKRGVLVITMEKRNKWDNEKVKTWLEKMGEKRPSTVQNEGG